MKIFNFNHNKSNINFKNNNPLKLPNLDMFGLNFSNPFSPLRSDVFERQAPKDEDDDLLKNIDNQAFKLAFAHVDGEISEEAEALWKLNFAIPFYIELFHDHMASFKKEKLDLDFYDEFTLNLFSVQTREEMKKYFKKSNIDNFDALMEVAQVYGPLKAKYKQVEEKGLDFIYACAYLDENKKELVNFPNIFMEAAKNSLYFHEEHNLYDYGLFVHDLGIKNENAFMKKFAHLAPMFNDFRDSDDKLAAFEYVYKTYAIKEVELLELASKYDYLANKTVCEIYMAHNDVIDYLYEQEPNRWTAIVDRILAQNENQEPLSPKAIDAVSELVDARSAKGKVELYDILHGENVTINELNYFSKSEDYLDLKPLDFIINSDEIIDKLALLDGFDEKSAQEFYLKFHQTLNAIYDEKDKEQNDKFRTLIKIVEEFGIKDDKEFLKFYSTLEGSSKQAKGKKGQTNQRKPKAQFVSELISLFAFVNDDLISKYKKDKHFPIKTELQKRKAQFDKVKPELEKQISAFGATQLLVNSQEVFLEYENLLKTNPNVKAFVQKVIQLKTQENMVKTQAEKTRMEFLTYFKDEKLLDEFLAKNGIEIDETKESQIYCAVCLRILGDIFDGKDEKEQEKSLKRLMKNDFLANAGTGIIKFARNKDDMELEILFEIILNENIETLAQINTILNKYKGKNGDSAPFLMNFKNYDISFKAYVKTLENIQKEFDNAGIPIRINSDNIFAIDLNEFDEGKIADSKLALLAKNILNPYNQGNFINGLGGSKIKRLQRVNPNMIAKELLLSMGGRYEQEYSNLIDRFNINKNALIAQLANNNMTIVGLSAVDSLLVELLNSPAWQVADDENCEFYNLTFHAKMRILDRFIFGNPEFKNATKEDIEKELKEILSSVYNQNPIRTHKAENSSFVTYCNYKNSEIKAVFEQNGQMLTIIKR